MRKVLALCLLGCAAVAAQTAPAPTELPSSPFSIKKTWIIGGEGNWDFLTADPAANRLYIAHSRQVQVVNVETGQLDGAISGFSEAHAIALDDSGGFGYISDGLAAAVKVFDRRALRIVASIPTAPNPRSLVFDSPDQLLFAFSYLPASDSSRPPVKPIGAKAGVTARPAVNRTPSLQKKDTTAVTVIDAQSQTALGQIFLPGKIDSALSDSEGQIFFSIVGRQQLFRLDASASASLLRDQKAGSAASLDWTANSAPGPLRAYALPGWCSHPGSLAVDSHDQRLFAVCESSKLAILNTSRGGLVASLPLTSGKDALAYDANHGLLYAADGYGNLTIIHQHITDTYAVVQELPTRMQAHSLAVNQETGEVYLVTQQMGVDLSKTGGIGALKELPLPGSFQILVVGN
jgi:DNA-binding beta-propeller fold protein YncE